MINEFIENFVRVFRRYCLLTSMMFAASMLHVSKATSEPRSEVGRVLLGDREVILFDDGFWRYAGGTRKICHTVPEVGEFCSSPEVWTAFPARQTDTYKRRPQFISGDQFWAQANALVPITGPVSAKDVEAFIRNRVFLKDGSRPNLQIQDQLEIDGNVWERLVFDGGGIVKAFAFRPLLDRVIIVETHEGRTSLFGKAHKDLQQSFLQSLEINEDG